MTFGVRRNARRVEDAGGILQSPIQYTRRPARRAEGCGIPPLKSSTRRPLWRTPNGMSEVLVRSATGLSATVRIGEHELTVDEPVSAGGMDAGPNPYELLLAALGSCTAITVRMYAQMKGWPLSSVEVRLSHERVHAEDCASCETREGLIDRISKELVLHGELDDVQRERLASIAERCPVHRTLSREVVIDQRLVPL